MYFLPPSRTITATVQNTVSPYPPPKTFTTPSPPSPARLPPGSCQPRDGEQRVPRAAGTLEDGQRAVGSQVPPGIVAELQSSGAAGAPAAGPLIEAGAGPGGVRGVGAFPGGARVALRAQHGAGRLERRVLDAAALHGGRGRCHPRLRAAPAPNAPLNIPGGGPAWPGSAGPAAAPPGPAPLLPRRRPGADSSPRRGRRLPQRPEKHADVLQQQSF